MSTAKRTVLVADPDRAHLRTLAEALHGRGYRPLIAKDGIKALELAVLNYPDAILYAADCPFIGAKKYTQILRSNPRTEHTPLILMTSPDVPAPFTPGFREAQIAKPFHIGELSSLIEEMAQRLDTARRVRSEQSEIDGTIEQLAIPDLLQILSQNRKTGLLVFPGGEEEGRIYLLQGHLVHAELGRARGAKALFRIIALRSGRFAFIPGNRPRERTLSMAAGEAVMEGLRQTDEYAKTVQQLPGLDARVQISAKRSGEVHAGLHPVTAEVLELTRTPVSIRAILNDCRATDFEALRAVQTLLQRGVLQTVEDSAPRPTQALPLASERAIRLLRARVKPQVSGDCRALFLTAASDTATRALFDSLCKLPAFKPASKIPEHMGVIGTLEIDKGLVADFYALPENDAFLPLWHLLRPAAQAALVLADEQGAHWSKALSRMWAGLPVRLLNVVPGAKGVEGAAHLQTIDWYGNPRDALSALIAAAAEPDATPA